MMDFDTFVILQEQNSFMLHVQLLICQYKKPSFIRVAAFSLMMQFWCQIIIVTKEKTIKLLPYHSFYVGQIPPRKIEPPFLAVRLNIYKATGLPI